MAVLEIFSLDGKAERRRSRPAIQCCKSESSLMASVDCRVHLSGGDFPRPALTPRTWHSFCGPELRRRVARTRWSSARACRERFVTHSLRLLRLGEQKRQFRNLVVPFDQGGDGTRQANGFA